MTVPLIATSNSTMCHKRYEGYTYFGVLFVVALMGLALSGAALIFQVEQQRDKERQLLFIGQQYIDAIRSYYHTAPNSNKIYPRKLEDLLRDPRYLTIKRHLRRPWLDPMTQKYEWGLVYTRQGGIAGVFSQSKGKPLKQAGFGLLEDFLAKKSNYQQWQFIYIAAIDETQDKVDESNVTEEDIQSDNENQDVEDQESDIEAETGEELLPEGYIQPSVKRTQSEVEITN